MNEHSEDIFDYAIYILRTIETLPHLDNIQKKEGYKWRVACSQVRKEKKLKNASGDLEDAWMVFLFNESRPYFAEKEAEAKAANMRTTMEPVFGAPSGGIRKIKKIGPIRRTWTLVKPI